MSTSSCGCLPMCNFTDLAITLHALPTRAGRLSPWRSYLKTVYGHTIPPNETVNISALELFYLSRLPVQWCNTPRCPRCDGWLDRKAVLRLTSGTFAIQEQRTRGWFGLVAESEEAYAKRMEEERAKAAARAEQERAKAIRALRSRGGNAQGMIRAQGGFVLHVTAEDRSAASSDSWVEVYREGGYPAEGVGYGCWLWRARGSGIFINVKRTLSFAERFVRPGLPLSDSAYGTLGITTCGNHTFIGRAIKLASYAKRGSTVGPFCSNDFLWATRAQALGFSSVQVCHSHLKLFEIILSIPSCTDQHKQIDLCLPESVPLRTGWNASLRHELLENTFMRKCRDVHVDGLNDGLSDGLGAQKPS